MSEKMPRHYAAEIIDMETREERRKYLETHVPEIFKDWVRFYVVDHFERQKFLRKYKNDRLAKSRFKY